MTINHDRYTIFPGRFQPFHNGHDEVVQNFLRRYPDQLLCLAIVFSLSLTKNSIDIYDRRSADHLLPERNPFTAWQRLFIIQQYIKRQQTAQLMVTLLPQPSRLYSWPTIENMFNGKRTWVIPVCGEEWDEQKALFFSEMGDDILRVPSDSKVNGFVIRTALANRDFEIAKQSVPAVIWKSIEALQ